jgi:hypothetical protein
MEIFNSNKSYSFSEIFDPNAEDAGLGFSLSLRKLNLPSYQGELERPHQLSNRIQEVLPFINLTTERACREILVAPVVAEIIHYTQAELRIEYPLRLSEQPHEPLDYLLTTNSQIIVIEAVEEDSSSSGIKKLATAMIALDQWIHTPNQSILLGAITTGHLWRFACLHRANKHIELGIEIYHIPDDIEPLMRIFINVLHSADFK